MLLLPQVRALSCNKWEISFYTHKALRESIVEAFISSYYAFCTILINFSLLLHFLFFLALINKVQKVIFRPGASFNSLQTYFFCESVLQSLCELLGINMLMCSCLNLLCVHVF